MTTDAVLNTLQLGARNIRFAPYGLVRDKAEQDVFSEAVLRRKTRQSLYLERVGGVKFISEGSALFRARIALPANVPIGEHKVRAFLFKDGEFIDTTSTDLTVKKIGFEQFTYDLAHDQSLLYGILAVLIAILTGWIAGIVFRKD